MGTNSIKAVCPLLAALLRPEHQLAVLNDVIMQVKSLVCRREKQSESECKLERRRKWGRNESSERTLSQGG